MHQGLHLVTPSHTHSSKIIESVVLIHAWCILNDNTMATYLPPLSYDVMLKDWQNLFEETTKDTRIIVVYLSDMSTRSISRIDEVVSPFETRSWPIVPPATGTESSGLEVAGVVSLSWGPTQTGSFRGEVQRLLVSPFHRRKGIATTVMAEMEKQALHLGKWNLKLDTTVGTPAEFVYPKLGYEKLGVVREYGFSPKDGKLLDEVFYWKDLRKGVVQNVLGGKQDSEKRDGSTIK